MKKKFNIALLVGILLVATNLRAPITSVGPLVGVISEQLTLSGGQSGFITTIPLLAFAIVSPLAPKFANKWQTERTIFGALMVLIIGLAIRALGSVPSLFIGTVIVGCGIAVCNVLIPSVIKQEFPSQSGLVTGLFSVSMNLTGAIASGLIVPLVETVGFSWNQALSIWLVLAIAALLGWFPQLKRHDKPTIVKTVGTTGSLWQSSLAWSVTLFMGIQSFIFYVLVAWLPEMLVEQGLSASQAGGMLSLLQFTLLPITFIIPIIAEKKATQTSYATMSAGLFFTGIIGLMKGGTVVVTLSIMGLGIAGGMAFSLAMIFFNLRTSTAKEAAELSGMAQSVGYLLAAVGPFLFGVLHDKTGEWQSSLFLLLGMTVAFFIVGLKAGSNQQIGTNN